MDFNCKQNNFVCLFYYQVCVNCRIVHTLYTIPMVMYFVISSFILFCTSIKMTANVNQPDLINLLIKLLINIQFITTGNYPNIFNKSNLMLTAKDWCQTKNQTPKQQQKRTRARARAKTKTKTNHI